MGELVTSCPTSSAPTPSGRVIRQLLNPFPLPEWVKVDLLSLGALPVSGETA